MAKSAPASCRTLNRRACDAALKQRGMSLIRFDPETEWMAAPSAGMVAWPRSAVGRPRACLLLKPLIEPPVGRMKGLVASLPILAALNSPVPDRSTL